MKMCDFIGTAKKLPGVNMGLKEGEKLLVLYDETTLKIGESLFIAGEALGAETLSVRMSILPGNGVEPPSIVSEAMTKADVVVAPLGMSITHTQARKKAAAAGVRIATMPRITEDMFFNGPITADYTQVAELTRKVSSLLDKAEIAEIITGDGKYSLKMSLKERKGVPSTGVYTEKGQSGNLPSGEGYTAPVEGSADGKILIDGSFVGFGKLKEPVVLTFEKGRMVHAEGAIAEDLYKMLGENPLARNLAELGIGTNDKARVTGVILEDEKIYGTVHIALGSNDTFGGTVAAGIHVDGVVKEPVLKLDGKTVLEKGHLILE